jgi:type II secretory pathway component PulJ
VKHITLRDWFLWPVLTRIRRLEEIMALNQRQTEALTAAVGQLGTDIRELADRLESDDATVEEAVTTLRSFGEQLDSFATNPASAGSGGGGSTESGGSGTTG